MPNISYLVYLAEHYLIHIFVRLVDRMNTVKYKQTVHYFFAAPVPAFSPRRINHSSLESALRINMNRLIMSR